MTLIEEIHEWDSDLSRPFYSHSFNSIYEILVYKEKNFFNQFSPTAGHGHPAFWDRLDNWLGNVSDDKDKKALFEFTLNIHFFTTEDFKHLFLSAFSGPIKRWIIDLYDITLDKNIDGILNSQLHDTTWYCSATDMDIGGFYRVNNITGVEVRPDFNTLSAMGDVNAINTYMSSNGFNKIVLLEDFVGAGTQFSNILSKCNSYFGNIPILFVPLLICSNGLRDIRVKLRNHNNWSINPVIIIDEDDRLNSNTELSNKPLESEIVNIAQSFSHHTHGSVENDRVYGFKNTGAMIVLHSNTPDNTIPLIWWTENWNALFPRSPRI
jgi:hypothetical protein